MTIRQLEVFLAVVRARGFRRAAEALALTQPALSQHVRELERELGTRLLDRTGRVVIPTEAGRLLQDHAVRVFATLESARRGIREIMGLERGSLVVGASTTPGIYVLPGVVASFGRRYSGIDVRLRIANSSVVEARVRDNELDLGVVGGHRLRPGEECLSAGLVDELVLIVPPGHPWAGRREIAPTALGTEALLMREEGSATRDLTERTLEAAGVRFRTAMELDHPEAIKQAVMVHLGVAFVSIHAIRGELRAGRLHAVRLHGVRLRRHFHVIHNEARTLTPAAQAFIRFMAVDEAARPSYPGRARARSVPGGAR